MIDLIIYSVPCCIGHLLAIYFIAYCLLPIVHCLLSIAYCPLPIVHCLLSIAYCPLSIVYCIMYCVIYCIGSLIDWLVFGVVMNWLLVQAHRSRHRISILWRPREQRDGRLPEFEPRSFRRKHRPVGEIGQPGPGSAGPLPEEERQQRGRGQPQHLQKRSGRGNVPHQPHSDSGFRGAAVGHGCAVERWTRARSRCPADVQSSAHPVATVSDDAARLVKVQSLSARQPASA